MKFSPLILFLLIISVLLISLLFSRYLPLEGFIDFGYDKDKKNEFGTLNSAKLPMYDPNRSLVKLYDNLYFDSINGNIIEIDGPIVTDETKNGATEVNINTIKTIWVTPRDRSSNTQKYDTVLGDNSVIKPSAKTLADIANVSSVKTQYLYTTNANTKDATTNKTAAKYQVLYIAYDTNTFVHVIDISNKDATTNNVTFKHLGTLLSTGPSNNTANIFTTSGENNSSTIGKIVDNKGSSSISVDTSNNIIVNDPLYDASNNVYQLSANVKYDLKNGFLVIKKAGNNSVTNQVEVYNRSGFKLNNTENTNTSTYYKNLDEYKNISATTPFNSFLVEDAATNPNTVLHIVSGAKTIIAILQKTATGYAIGSVKRFNASGLDETVASTSSGSGSTPAPPATDTSGNVHPPDASGNVYGEYYKWLAFWNATAQGKGAYSDDYMLKTSVVPPVCPSCPSCNSCSAGGVCANCGGNGGSGTLSSAGASIAGGSVGGSITPGSATASGSMLTGSGTGQMTTQGRGTYATTSDTNTLGGATTVQTLGVVSGVENVAQTGADVVSGAVGTVGGLASQALSTAGGLLYAGGSGAVNLAKSTGSGAVDLVKSAGSGTTNLLTGGRQGYDNQPAANQRTSIPTGAPSTGYSPNYNDNYSRYGALQGRGSSNFIPVTADFSKFGR